MLRAEALALKADKLNLTYELFELAPQDVLAEVERVRSSYEPSLHSEIGAALLSNSEYNPDSSGTP